MNVNGDLSRTAEPIIGVPEGSVMVPILFVIYVNDLSNNLAADSLLYANDVKFIVPRNCHEILQSSLISGTFGSKIKG